MSWLYFIPVLLIMVLIHEAGHFFMARLFGVKVLEFGVGFPPKAWSRVSKKSGIEYSVNWLPIGGFVRMDGENGDSSDPNSFGAKPPWQRAIILIAGPFMNLVLAFVIYLILATGGHDVPKGQVGLAAVSAGSPAAAAGLQPGDIILAVNGDNVKTTNDLLLDIAVNRSQPLDLTLLRNNETRHITVKARTPEQTPQGEGAIGIAPDYIYGKSIAPFQIFESPTGPDGKTLLGADGKALLQDGDLIVSADGRTFNTNAELGNYLNTVNADSVQLTINRQGQVFDVTMPQQVYISTVYKGSEADKAGLLAGSSVLSLDGTPVHTVSEYASYMQAHQGRTVTMVYYDTTAKKQGSIVIPANYTADGNQTIQNSGVSWSPQVGQRLDSRTFGKSLALRMPSEHQSLSPAGMIGDAWNQTVYAITLIPRTFNGLFNGSVSVKQLAGPVGMAQITSQVVDRGGLPSLITLMALLSVNLGIVNILPLPALDGGRLVFVLIEMVTRGKRIPPDKEGLVHLAGMVVLLTLMVFIAWNDILRLFTGGSFS